MIARADVWEDIKCAYGAPDIPRELEDKFNELDDIIKDANGLKHGCREDFGLRSTQIIGLVIFLYRHGLLKKVKP